MKYRTSPKGFTLVEILLALTIMALITSIVYGTYAITTQSVQNCQKRLDQARQGRFVLSHLTRQLRSICSNLHYPQNPPAHIINSPQVALQKKMPLYLSGGKAKADGIILHLIATTGFYHNDRTAGVLRELAYKYDIKSQTLFYREQKYIPGTERSEESEWFPLANHIQAVKIQFGDGQAWHEQWDSNHQQLPKAIKIAVSWANSPMRDSTFSTTTYIGCGPNKSVSTQGEMMKNWKAKDS